MNRELELAVNKVKMIAHAVQLFFSLPDAIDDCGSGHSLSESESV